MQLTMADWLLHGQQACKDKPYVACRDVVEAHAMERVRIRKTARPYAGRLLEVAGRETYPNGRSVVRVYPPRKSKYYRTLEYELHEVQEVQDEP